MRRRLGRTLAAAPLAAALLVPPLAAAGVPDGLAADAQTVTRTAALDPGLDVRSASPGSRAVSASIEPRVVSEPAASALLTLGLLGLAVAGSRVRRRA